MAVQVEQRNSSRTLLNALLGTVVKPEFFSSDSDDEFRVKTADDKDLGIFKTWAFPIIPLIESLGLEDATQLLGNNTDTEILKTIEDEWHQTIIDKPRMYAQTLERWRAFSERWDRRLQQVFLKREIPTDPKEAFIELFLRLKMAFALGSTFYNIEAMVVDPRDNALTRIQKTDVPGGALDLAGMMLPSAVKEKVLASQLNWNGLDWNAITQLISQLSETEFALVSQLASLAEVDMKDILFAANVLEWIPSSVGGKKDDLDSEESLSGLLSVLKNDQYTDGHGLVAKNMNALIRFRNWMPIVHTDENFTEANSWSYAAVCDTSNQVFGYLDKDGILNPQAKKIFVDTLQSQLQNLDATSARGRFVLQVVKDGLLSLDLQEQLNSRESDFFDEICTSLDILEKDEAVVDLMDAHPRALVGGKAFGIREAATILGKEKVIQGNVITSEAVENHLKAIGVWDKIIILDRITDQKRILKLANEITTALENVELPTHITEKIRLRFGDKEFVVRSSSQDEDTVSSTAAGIYDSELRVKLSTLNSAFSTVLRSFFSEKAIGYRQLNGLSHKPMLGMVLQEFKPGEGGVIFTEGNGKDFHLDFGISPEAVVNGENGTTEIQSNQQIDEIPAHLQGVVQDALTVEKMSGKRVDMEFVQVDTTVQFLQKRNLPEGKRFDEEIIDSSLLETIQINSLSDLELLTPSSEALLRLELSSKVDVDQFQGHLFRWLIKNKSKVKEIHLDKPIAMTSHFANICEQLHIRITF